jgi:hypothetical protein
VTAPRKHHFIPAFYLKQWAATDGQVCEYKRVMPGKIVPRRKHPNATGFEIDLYRIDGHSDALAQAVETEFMKPVDTEADLALQKMLRADPRLRNERERSAFTRFIFSLLYRHPEGVRELKEQMRDVYLAGIDALREHYAEQWMPNNPPTFEEFMARTRPEAAQRAAMNMLQGIIDNENVGPTINNMHWTRVSLVHAATPSLTSDRPVVKPFGLSRADAYIALPISPHVLFVAGHDGRWAKICEATPPAVVVEMINQAVVAQAHKTVWGVDEGQLAFVEEWMSRQPDRPLISPEQKKAAIAAVRGESSG